MARGACIMSLEHLVVVETHTVPIRHQGEVHNGKVRSVYWLTPEDSTRVIKQRNYPLHSQTPLGIMVISDRISAFDCNWKGEEGLGGIPGKGAALNAISQYWFKQFNGAGLSRNHILEAPHPLVWIVERTQPIKIEAIARQYITGSMWRAYSRGERDFCGIQLPDGLHENQRLDSLLKTPTTKGVLCGIPGVPEEDDVNITRAQIHANYEAFGFRSPHDIELYETLLTEGFRIISSRCKDIGQIFVDTKFEFGYPQNEGDHPLLIYIDEVGTPDSSRMWDAQAYKEGYIIENSKEGFRQFLLGSYDRDVLLDKKRMEERKRLSVQVKIPLVEMYKLSKTYAAMAQQITGSSLPQISNPREEMIDALKMFGVVE